MEKGNMKLMMLLTAISGFGLLMMAGWLMAFVATRHAKFSAKWAMRFTAAVCYRLISRIFLNFLAALTVSKDWNLRPGFVKKWQQTPDSLMNGDGGDKGFYELWFRRHLKAQTYYNRFGRYCMKVLTAWAWSWRNCAHGFLTYGVGLDRNRVTHVEIVDDRKGSTGRFNRILLYDINCELVGFEENRDDWLRVGDKYQCAEHQKKYPAQMVWRIRPWKMRG